MSWLLGLVRCYDGEALDCRGWAGCLAAELTHPGLYLLWPAWQPGFPAQQTSA